MKADRKAWNTLRIGKKHDKRIKFTDEKKDICLYLYRSGESITKIAKTLGLSKRTIQFFLFPERHEKNKEDRKKRGGSMIYYNKEYHTEQMRKYRQHLVEVHNIEKTKIADI